MQTPSTKSYPLWSAAVEAENIYGLYRIEPKRLNRHNDKVNGSHHKPLIERRRRHSHDHTELVFQSGVPHNRRSGDQMRIRFQRWIELADVALRNHSTDPKDGNDR